MGYDFMDIVDMHLKNSSLLYNTSVPDITKPLMRSSVEDIYPLFIFLHAILLIVGAVGNIGMLVYIVRKKLHRSATFLYLSNLCVSDTFSVVVVMPFTLTNLMLQNWIFGCLFCYVFPMLHFLPIHASVLSYLMLATDRCRHIVYPMKSRLPPVVCILAVWIISVCAVLPNAFYLRYIDLGDTPLGAEFRGTGVCYHTIEYNSEKYIRAIFVILFCLPLGITASLFIKVSRELDTLSTTDSSLKIDNASRYSEGSYQSHVTWLSNENEVKIGTDLSGNASGRRYSMDTSTEEGEDETVDIHKEKRAQRYLAAMVTSFGLCWLPVNILKMVTHFVQDDDEHSKNYDITYIAFTFVGFLSTSIRPLLFMFWRMSSTRRKELCKWLTLGKMDSCSTYAGPIMSSHKSDRSYEGVVGSNIKLTSTEQ